MSVQYKKGLQTCVFPLEYDGAIEVHNGKDMFVSSSELLVMCTGD